jgi:hypothetical protein
VGQVTIDAKATVFPTGVSATTNEPYVLVWGEVNPDTVWAEVTGSEKTWDENAPNPGTVWTEIAA